MGSELCASDLSHSKPHTPLGGFLNCELGGRHTFVLLNLHYHLHHHLQSPSPAQLLTPSQLPSPSKSFHRYLVGMLATRDMLFPSPSLLFSSHCLYLLLSSMPLHLHSYLHLQSLSPVPGAWACWPPGPRFLPPSLLIIITFVVTAVHAAVIIPPISLGSPQSGF